MRQIYVVKHIQNITAIGPGILLATLRATPAEKGKPMWH
ncbi:hypothetical protein RG47T_0050 [Mucilaginibacter polytrichastri]|uniref:Uncharacterized protein n=1 Tax=Mucilaginibacter polytrichastri TaxID=1302689 RepID=A0A1Q5ZSG0_9SPHI|nr:hypothetical protein RG47T_0050 [Mucilaginibacter polytrichastri]